MTKMINNLFTLKLAFAAYISLLRCQTFGVNSAVEKTMSEMEVSNTLASNLQIILCLYILHGSFFISVTSFYWE